MKNLTFFLLLLVAMMSVTRAVGQTGETKAGVIILKNGEIIFGTSTEITPDIIKYVRTDITDGTIYTIKRSEVYAIVHPDQTKEIITPLPGQSKDDLMRAKSKKDTLKYYLTHGLVRAGVGFVQNHGSVSTSGYNTSGPPGFLVGYVARLNSSILLGIQVAFNNFEYTSSQFSDYDNTQIDRKIKDKIIAPGLYARYNLTTAFIKPYITGGVSMNWYKLDTESHVLFLDNNKGVDTGGSVHGTQFDLILRAGVDLSLSSKFGAYGDIGFGTNLIQLGVFFNLQ